MKNMPSDALSGLISKTKWYVNTYTAKLFKEQVIEITVEQWVLLIIICKFPGITQTELALSSQKDKTNVTRMLDVLERDHYIKREKDPDDRRVYKIILTDNGNKILKKTEPLFTVINNKIIKGFTKEQEEMLKGSLLQICSNIKKELEA